MSFRTVKINDTEIDLPAGLSLIQACEEVGVEIPRFCYHERLSIAGNCRMCLVEVKGAPKPMASCAVSLGDLRGGPNGEPPQIITNSPMVKKAREGVMGFLLSNHPLDCPICDQGGECDLQDQAMAYGNDRSHFTFEKRAVPDKEMGPLIKTIMTRCIHCTRCVRFSTEVAGAPELGAINRGEDTEITPYLDNIVSSELSANVIDLCPVGALTSKPYAFVARPWEMKKIPSYDVTDAMGSAIMVHVRGNEVMRIVPRNDDDVNEEWISNKTRFHIDGLKSQRLDRPFIRIDGKLTPASWQEALERTASHIKENQDSLGFFAGKHTNIETVFAAQLLAEKLGAVTEGRPEKSLPYDNIAATRFNHSIADIDLADMILMIGSNPRKEAAVLNARIRKAWLKNDTHIAVIGEEFDTTYPYTHLGDGADALKACANGTLFSEQLKNAQCPVIIIGQGAVSQDGAMVLKYVQDIMSRYQISEKAFCFLTDSISLGGVMELGFVNNQDNSLKTIISLGADESEFPKESFKIYIGSHGDKGASEADIILPAAAYTEKESIYITMEGRVRHLQQATFPPGEAKDDWAILRALSQMLDMSLPFDQFDQLRSLLFSKYPMLNNSDVIIKHALNKIDVDYKADSRLYVSHIERYYKTDAMCRASRTLHQCQKEFYDSVEKETMKEVA